MNLKHKALIVAICAFMYGCGNADTAGKESLTAPLDYIETVNSPKYAKLRKTLDVFVAKTIAGEDFAAMYLGNKMLVLSDNIYNEILLRETNRYYVPLTYGCGNTCGLTLTEIVELLDSHLNSLSTRKAEAPLSSVRSWPSLTIMNDDTTWKISFDMRGETLVSVEIFGPIAGVHARNQGFTGKHTR